MPESNSSNAVRETPSETLMRALEDIENAEDVVILWRKKDEDGEDRIEWSINDAPWWRVMGLMEMAKAEMIIQSTQELPEED